MLQPRAIAKAQNVEYKTCHFPRRIIRKLDLGKLEKWLRDWEYFCNVSRKLVCRFQSFVKQLESGERYWNICQRFLRGTCFGAKAKSFVLSVERTRRKIYSRWRCWSYTANAWARVLLHFWAALIPKTRRFGFYIQFARKKYGYKSRALELHINCEDQHRYEIHQRDDVRLPSFSRAFPENDGCVHPIT